MRQQQWQRPGFRFYQGQLKIVSDRVSYLLDTWPDLRSRRKTADSGYWQEITPGFRLLKPRVSNGDEALLGPERLESSAVDPLLEKAQAFRSFRHSLPPDVAKAVEVVPNRQWDLLLFCRQNSRFAELVESNPALAYCVTQCDAICGMVHDIELVANRVVKMKQRDILDWLGFPGAKSWIKILRKFDPGALRVDEMKRLLRTSETSSVEGALGHLRRINIGVMRIVSDWRYRNMIAPSLLEEVANEPEERRRPATAEMLCGILAMLEQMKEQFTYRRFPSIPKVRTAHQEVTERFNLLKQGRGRKGLFPAAPIQGTIDIVPIKNVAELTTEGWEQKNCVGSYAKRVKAREVYIYRVLRPERATLSIGPTGGGWGIRELKCKCNESVSPETEAAVQRWLDEHSLGV